MSGKELRRVEVMGRVKAKSLRLWEAAELLGLSYRQSKRIWARYRSGGAKALQHGNCGRASNRGYPSEFRAAVLKQVKARYEDFGSTLAAEHLASDDGLEVHAETLRRWLKEAGQWQRRRRRKPYRRRREAKAHLGELVQLDGSFHEWLEDRGPRGCFMHMVDDATAQAMGWFSAEESIWAAVAVLRRWIERYGVPQALYTDWKNVYVRPPNAQERMRGEPAVTQFGRMCSKLGIAIIAASSPQAKGRVERAHGTHQDRLVKKLRLTGIANYEQANAYLDAHYLAEHNRRYAHAATSPSDYHRRRPTARQLDEIFWLEEPRVISEDWVVRYQNRLLQLERPSRPRVPAKSHVLVRENEAGDIAIHYRDHRLVFRELKAASTALSEGRGSAPSPAPPSPRLRRSLPPAAHHPWRLGFQQRTSTNFSGAA
ncbi:MAG TPA: ISNCY family transposase [Anaerolineales bacterium]